MARQRRASDTGQAAPSHQTDPQADDTNVAARAGSVAMFNVESAVTKTMTEANNRVVIIDPPKLKNNLVCS